MSLPALPRGLCRDETVHGKLYFTSAQMREYAQDAIGDWIKKQAKLPGTKTPPIPKFLRGLGKK